MWIASAFFALAASNPAVPPPEVTTGSGDARPNIEVSAYFGLGIDNFAATDVRQYLNPNSSGQSEERFVGGLDFAVHIRPSRGARQLWIYGETVHGLRSAEVDCKSSPGLEVCQPFATAAQTPATPTLFLLRKATSIEAFLGLRYELAALTTGADTTKLYAKAQAGFITVARSGGDVMDSHHLGVGVLAVSGSFAGSYLEVGWGRSDVFHSHRGRRLKLDALVSFPGMNKGLRPFAQITVDSDFGRGADSVQSYLGVDFDITKLLGGGK